MTGTKIVDQLYWWLGRKKPFYIEDQYKLELLHIDKINNSAKIKVTNLKTGVVVTTETEGSDNE